LPIHDAHHECYGGADAKLPWKRRRLPASGQADGIDDIALHNENRNETRNECRDRRPARAALSKYGCEVHT
jgi:hypothetical protein